MIKFLKSNKLMVLLVIFMCLVFAINPQTYANSCLNALSVWTIKILPVMFPFFVFTRIIVNLSENKPNFMDKFFNRAYHTPNGSFRTFLLATLSGYPMGAKLISIQYDQKQTNSSDASKMLSFCSISGPMFMLGTVGLGIFGSYKAGIIILVSNILSCLINGFIYRGKQLKTNLNFNKINTKKTTSFSIQINDSLNSILMVGAYIVLSFIIIDMLINLQIIDKLTNTICCVFNCKNNQHAVSSILCGTIEITRGIIELNSTNLSLQVKTIISSTLIGFGGFSIFFQSMHFLEKLKIKKRIILLQKFTQSLICLVVSNFLCLIFL